MLGALPWPLELWSKENWRLQVSWLSWVVKTAPQDEGPLQEEEGEEEQLCEAGGAGHGGHHREGPTAGGEE